MKTDIWMPWYISDYEKDTKALSLEEDCIYRRALDYLWQNPAGLPRVSDRLSRCLRISLEEAKRLSWVLDEFLEKDEKFYRSRRVDIEYEKSTKRAEIARENGRKGGRPSSQEKPSGLPDGLAKLNPEDNQNYNPEKSSSSSSSPSSSPSQSKSSSSSKTTLSTKVDPLSESVVEIFQFWKVELNHPKAVLDQKRSKAIRARLKEGYTVERIKEAIEGIQRCAHNMGVNDRQEVYDDIELICRSGANVDRFADTRHGENVHAFKAKQKVKSYLIGEYNDEK